MSDIKFNSYVNTNSDVHKLNALIKLISLFIFSITIFLTQNIKALLILSVFVIIIYTISYMPIKLLKRIFKISIIFSLFILISNLMLNISIYTSLFSIWRLILLITYSYIFTFSTKINDISDSILTILNFFKIKNKNEIAIIIIVSIKFIPRLFENFKKLEKKNIENFIKLIVYSIKESEQLAETLYIRFYDLYDSKKKQQIKIFDYIVLSIHIILFCIVVFK